MNEEDQGGIIGFLLMVAITLFEAFVFFGSVLFNEAVFADSYWEAAPPRVTKPPKIVKENVCTKNTVVEKVRVSRFTNLDLDNVV